MVELFSLCKSKLEIQTYGLRHTRNFLYHVLAFRTLFKIMTPKEKTEYLFKKHLIAIAEGTMDSNGIMERNVAVYVALRTKVEK